MEHAHTFINEIEEEESYVPYRPPTPEPEPIPVCRCLRSDASSEKTPEMSERKQQVLSTVSRTEQYLAERRITELIRFLITKLISDAPAKPHFYLEKLLDDCMLFKVGLGLAPVLYERRHLEAVVKSFDPMNRGWLSAGQVRRAYNTLGLNPDEEIEEKTSTEKVLEDLVKTQEEYLLKLLSAGSEIEKPPESESSSMMLTAANSKSN